MENMHFDSILAKKLSMFVPLTALELRWLAEIQAKPLKVKRGKQITQQGQMGHRAYVLQAGWACSYKDLPNGNRQIISFPIAGDCVGLRSVLLQTADHSILRLTDASQLWKAGTSWNASASTPGLGQRSYGLRRGTRR